jgi:hypothetical protein
MQLYDLCLDVLITITENLNCADYIAMSQTCKKLHTTLLCSRCMKSPCVHVLYASSNELENEGITLNEYQYTFREWKRKNPTRITCDYQPLDTDKIYALYSKGFEEEVSSTDDRWP